MDDNDLEDWLRRAASGDQLAWDSIVGQFKGMLWAIARSYRLDMASAADAVQATWLRLVESIGRISEPSKLGSWLATTCRRECLQVLRRSKREFPSMAAESLADAPDNARDLDADLLDDERDAALWRVFGKLAPRCQLLLRVLMASPPPAYAEVAAALDWPVGTIGPTRQRCLAHLRRLARADDVLGDDDEERRP